MQMGQYIGLPNGRVSIFKLGGICTVPMADAVATGKISCYNCTGHSQGLISQGYSRAVQRPLTCDDRSIQFLVSLFVCSLDWCVTLNEYLVQFFGGVLSDRIHNYPIQQYIETYCTQCTVMTKDVNFHLYLYIVMFS